MDTPYFFYDPNEGHPEFFSSEVERNAYANKALAAYRSQAADNQEWHNDVLQILCGVVTHVAQYVNEETLYRPPLDEIDEDGYDDEGNSWNDGHDTISTVDVAMVPVALPLAPRPGDPDVTRPS